VLLGAGEYLGNTLGNRAVDLVGPQSTPWGIFPIDELRRAAIREPDFVAAAERHSFVIDQSDICHAP
jgi:hypothetical protein